MTDELHVGLVGAQFMGRAHSNAYLKVASAFDLPARPVRRAACDINPAALETQQSAVRRRSSSRSVACPTAPARGR